MDLASSSDRSALLHFVREEFGRIDLLVNNAGIAPRERRDILDATEESFSEVLDTNLKGPYFLTQAVAKLMREIEGGRIVFVTSISAFNRAQYDLLFALGASDPAANGGAQGGPDDE